MRITSIVLTTALTLALTSPAASAAPALTLARPTGDRPVGTTSPPDLPVSLFYPTVSADGPKSRFMTEAEAKTVLDSGGITGVAPSVLAGIRTDSVLDAPPAGHHLPLVVLDPGARRPRGELTSLAEDLASHGTLVAVAPGAGEDKAVLDKLLRSKWAALVDPARIGLAGAAGVPAALAADPRLEAGTTIDGPADDPLPAALDRPVLFLGRATAPGNDTWKQLTGWKRQFTVAGTVHASFTDIGLVGEQLGLRFGATTPAVRGQAITAAYVRAFFDQHLRGRPQPLLDQPSARYPEVALTRTSTPYLPAPTGDRPVGSTAVYLKDTSRPDPWVPSVPYRELMVTLFYPAASAKGPKTQYLTPAESAALLEGSGLDVPPGTLAETVTNSVDGARPAGRGLPLIVLSPGYTKPRATLSALAEDLASHGYAVALVGHTYENTGQSFPDGRFAGCASCEVPHDDAFWEKLERGRATDVSFVLDSLLRSRAGLIDPERIGMAGHSIGGASTLPSMVADSRLKAGMDIDGTTHVPLTGLARPFMFLGHQLGATACVPGDPTWERDWPQLTGWKRWADVRGAQHASFTDVGLFGDEFGVDYGAQTTALRTQEITRTYVNAFFDRHLRGEPRPVLDRPGYPEVSFCH
ncbi:esterase [Amycolatopsis sp. Hca4]|uniref:esterase n=1 Tax=Amycolatopsis sp. Hca4 TaxID=2742131 RepID=UPI001591435D|nr:esterase [Amycolatopsis sp. Hca4]QKV78802.1 esterase [Amycolatopsis sp. Hca4]